MQSACHHVCVRNKKRQKERENTIIRCTTGELERDSMRDSVRGSMKVLETGASCKRLVSKAVGEPLHRTLGGVGLNPAAGGVGVNEAV